MNKRDEYVRNLRSKLEEWSTEIDTLTVRAREISADAKIDYKEQIESLKAKREAARQKIDELQQTGESAWEDVKSGVEFAWSALSEAID